MSMSMSSALSKSLALSITAYTQRPQELTRVNDLVVDVEEFVEIIELFFSQAWCVLTSRRSLAIRCPGVLWRHDFFLFVIVKETARLRSIIGDVGVSL